jgi:hypothetical protein
MSHAGLNERPNNQQQRYHAPLSRILIADEQGSGRRNHPRAVVLVLVRRCVFGALVIHHGRCMSVLLVLTTSMSIGNGFSSHRTGGASQCLMTMQAVAACHSASTNSRSGLESAWRAQTR